MVRVAGAVSVVRLRPAGVPPGRCRWGVGVPRTTLLRGLCATDPREPLGMVSG